jgi:transcription initiation factor IIE alpha subunit
MSYGDPNDWVCQCGGNYELSQVFGPTQFTCDGCGHVLTSKSDLEFLEEKEKKVSEEIPKDQARLLEA